MLSPRWLLPFLGRAQLCRSGTTEVSIFCLAAALGLCSLPATAQGDVLFSALGTGANAYSTTTVYFPVSGAINGNSIGQARAMEFAVQGSGSQTVSQIDLGVSTGGAAGPGCGGDLQLGCFTGAVSFAVSIWTDSGGVPGTQVANAHWTTSTNTLAYACCPVVSIPDISGVALTGGDQYFLVLTPLNPSSDFVFWYGNDVGTSGQTAYSVDGGATWLAAGVEWVGAFDILSVSTAGPASQTVTFGPLGNVVLGVAPFVISTMASSGLPVSLASTTPAVCMVSGNTVTVLTTGTCSITATQAGNATYSAATSATQSFAVTASGTGTAPFLRLIPPSINVQWTQGSPLPAPIPLSIYTQASSLPSTATASLSSGSSWLSVSPASVNAPATILVTVNPSSLLPGTYGGTVTVTAPAANPSSQTFTITVNVVAPGAPSLSVTPNSINYSFVLGAQQPVEQVIDIGNTGSGTLSYSAATSTTSGTSWLAASPATGTATISTPSQLTVTINPASLSAGTYTGSIVISAPSQQTVTIPVTVTVSSTQQIISLAQTALTFTAVAGGGTVPTQSFGIADGGSGVMNWSVSSSVTDTGNWLSVTPTSGSTDATSALVPLVTVSVNPANLAPGQYGGQIQVRSPSANNSPQFVSVILNVLPTGSNPGAVVTPTGLIFTQALGGAAPTSETVTVSNLTAANVSFVTQAETSDGGNWLVATPASGTAAPSQPATVMVSVNSAGLSAGVRQGILTLFFEDGTVQTVDVIYVLAAGGVTSARADLAHAVPETTAATCTPTKLLPLLTSLGSQFTVPAAWPNTLQAKVVDDCGNLQVSGTVVASFSNGDPPVPLISLKNGTWTGTWQVTNSNVSVISVTVNANNPSFNISGSFSVSGSLQNSVTAPVINAGGVLNAASYALSAPLAPGAMISIFGSNLANGLTRVNTLPLPDQASGTLVIIGGEPAPLLYAFSGQINAIVPFGLPVNTNTQVIVRQGNAYTAPLAITLAPANPGIFTVSGSGTGQGIIIRPDGNIARPGTPAQDGDELVIYAAGLGQTNPQATAGDASTSTPLEYAAGTATLTIGGQNARVDFAGLAPGFAGLYQINAAVPSGVHGDSLPVVLSVAGQPSPAITMAVE